MSDSKVRSRLTWAQPKARLRVEVGASGRPVEDGIEIGDDIQLPFTCLAATLGEQMTGAHELTDFQERAEGALDEDLTRIERSPSASTYLVRLVKRLFNERALRDALLSQVAEALAMTAREKVDPRASVDMHLLLPGSYVHQIKAEPLDDVDIALVFRSAPPEPDALGDLTRAMTPRTRVPTPAVVLQARRNAEARSALLEEFGALTSAEVAELAGSDAKNASALASRWRREGRIVAVDHHGTAYYPAFQFDAGGKPRPVIAEVLEHLDVSPWQQALWFTTANGWLDGRRPVDVLDEQPAAVVAAAREALREPVG
jgi:hypothetical protein